MPGSRLFRGGAHGNIRRIGEVAKLSIEAGTVVLTAFISPFERDRARVRALVPEGEFLEVYYESPLVCETQDVKGHYRRARRNRRLHGHLIALRYPAGAGLVHRHGGLSLGQSVACVLALLRSREIIE